MKLDVSGKRVLVSGAFSRLDNDDAEVALKKLGATIAEGLSTETDYLFAGDRSEAICHQAQELDVPILTEHALLDIIGMATRRRKDELFPSSANLALALDPDVDVERIAIPLPHSLRREHELVLLARRTDFITSRRFGETWGLKLSEFVDYYLGELELDGEPLSPAQARDDVEHMYYCRFRSDGSDYASGSQKFGAERGFHASWLRECITQLNDSLSAPAPASEDDTFLLEEGVEFSWHKQEDGVWLLKMSQDQSFGHVQAEEYEELVIDFMQRTWRWSHYFMPSDADI
jgi:hypothetical protein